MSARTAPFPEDECYNAVADRDPSAHTRFIYAVKTTGIYCRPTCKSRRPLRRNVEFFADVQAARAAGYRACKRCKPDGGDGDDRMVQACRYIESAESPPTLSELAAKLAMSEYHLQRQFTKQIASRRASTRRYSASGVRRANCAS
ncbi:MAG: hypothetical protein M3Y21_04865 [Candidatus Eremiobacteraeota bacterium]|nr:hypothetical protein [Candidatus Eremiobacteraeota bacterium]